MCDEEIAVQKSAALHLDFTFNLYNIRPKTGAGHAAAMYHSEVFRGENKIYYKMKYNGKK